MDWRGPVGPYMLKFGFLPFVEPDPSGDIVFGYWLDRIDPEGRLVFVPDGGEEFLLPGYRLAGTDPEGLLVFVLAEEEA
jgi:hypothetical protein